MRDPRALSARLLAAYAVAFLSLIGVLGLVVDQAVRAALLRQMIDDLAGSAGFLAARLGDDPAAAVASIEGLEAGARITLVRIDGTVLVDTAEDPAVMENHGDRPEVIAALGGGIGSDRRVSETIDRALLYVAVPPVPGADLVVRLAVSEEQVAERLGAFRRRVLLTTALVGLVGVGVVWFLGRRIASPIRALTDRATRMADGDRASGEEPSTITELAALGRALDAMATDLQGRIEAAQNARNELETILGALPVGVFMVEADRSVSFANTAAREMLAVSGRKLWAVLPEKFRLAIDQGASGTAAGASHTGGTPPRTLVLAAVPMGEKRVLAVIEDRTELERTDTVRRDFVASASHELKTPVATVQAAAEALLLAMERDPERTKEFARMITRSAEQLTRLTSDLLDLSRLESSEIVIAAIDLSSVAAEVAEAALPRCRAAGVELELSLEPAQVEGSRADLALALRNLLENAVRYSETGGSVTVTLTSDGDWARLTVADRGLGIPARALPRLFERFYRVDDARSRSTGGTGLGLAIVKHVMERHGGRVSVESTPGEGTEFTLTLPLSRPSEST